MRLSNALQSTMRSPAAERNVAPAPKPTHKLAQILTVPNSVAILKKYRRTSLAIFIAVLGIIVIAINLVPPTYTSESKLFVRVGRESISLDPTATTGQTISVYESRENEINSVVDVLQSRVILEQIAAKLASELIEEAPRDGTTYSKYQVDAAVRGLAQSIEVSHPKKSSVITITTTAKSPELAQAVLSEMLAAFREQHIRINRTQGSYQFFEEQWKREAEELALARGKLRDAKNTFGFASIESRRQNLESQISATETTIMQNERTIASINAEINALTNLMQRMQPFIQTQQVTGFFNDAREETREQIHQLEIEHRQLLTKYTERHPHVRAIKEKIDAGRAILSENSDPKNQTTNAANPEYQQLDLKRLTNTAQRDALLAEKESLQAQKQSLEQALTRLNENEIQLAGLQEEVAFHQASYKSYSEKLEQARIDRKLVDENISNVNVVQPATFIPRPVGPKKRLIYAVGFLVATLTAVGYGFVRELLLGARELIEHPAPQTTAHAHI